MITLPRTAPKAPGSLDRCVPLAETAALIPELRERFGITRVGDTSKLDRTDIPTYCAMVPKSPDILGVYNGKGRTLNAARVSAVMEAVERQAAASVQLPSRMLPMRTVLQTIDLRTLNLVNGAEDMTVECVAGTDLLTGAEVWIPLALVQFPWRGARILQRSSTNGLASGNTTTEAIYHALTEMIERHVWSLYCVRCEIVPRYYRGEHAEERALAKTLVFPTGNAYLDDLYNCIVSTGLRVRVSMLRKPPFAHVALVSVLEPDSEPPMAHLGLGCSLSPEHAVERALTEAIQSRVVDVQAAREDITRADDPRGTGHHAKRIAMLPRNCWFIDLPSEPVYLSELRNDMSSDLANDVRALLSQVSTAGVRNVAAVEIVNDARVSVIRICAPDFETTAVDGRLGPMALLEFNPLATTGKKQ